MKHIALKITAFIFGIALWLYVMSLNTFQVTITVPVRIVKLPEMLAIASKPPQYINVTVEGEAFDLMRLKSKMSSTDSNAASIVIDMQDAELGPTRKLITAKNFMVPSIPSIHFVEPENQLLFIDLELDTRIERNIPIHPNTTFEAAPGYLMTDLPKLTPEYITVSGARNALTRIIEIPTDSIKFDSLKSSENFEVALNFSQLPAHVTPSGHQVNIHTEIQKISSREFMRVPVQLIGIYDRKVYELSPDTILVEITGGEALLDSLEESDIAAFVEFNRFAIEDVDSLAPTIKINLPPEINREMSIKGIQQHPDKVRLQKNAVIVTDSLTKE